MKNSQFLPFIIYTTSWCGDCVRTKRWLEMNDFREGSDYTEIDIDEQEDMAEVVMELNQGRRTIPTLVFPDGSILVEPTDQQLADKLL
jgi:mycoredoxin